MVEWSALVYRFTEMKLNLGFPLQTISKLKANYTSSSKKSWQTKEDFAFLSRTSFQMKEFIIRN